MDIPKELHYLKSSFWDGSRLEAADERAWVSRALKMSTPAEQKVIKEFLDRLLNSDASDDELQSAWNVGSRTYGLHREQVRSFYKLIRDLIDEPLS